MANVRAQRYGVWLARCKRGTYGQRLNTRSFCLSHLLRVQAIAKCDDCDFFVWRERKFSARCLMVMQCQLGSSFMLLLTVVAVFERAGRAHGSFWPVPRTGAEGPNALSLPSLLRRIRPHWLPRCLARPLAQLQSQREARRDQTKRVRSAAKASSVIFNILKLTKK